MSLIGRRDRGFTARRELKAYLMRQLDVHQPAGLHVLGQVNARPS